MESGRSKTHIPRIALRLCNFTLFLMAGIFFGASGDGIAEAATVLHIRDDPEGGNCRQAGNWDPDDKTCTLTSDSSYLFIIESNGITLDGAGHTLTGAGPTDPADFIPGPDGGGFAVDITGRSGVTVKNLNLAQHDYGVHLSYSSNVTVMNITTSYSGLAGISLSYSSGNTITENSVSNPGMGTGICIGYASSNNIITGNRVSYSDRGIYLHDTSNANDISGNTLENNLWGLTLWFNDSNNIVTGNRISGGQYGIYLHSANTNNDLIGNTVSANSTGLLIDATGVNHVIANNFSGNTVHAVVNGSGSTFSSDAPEGGNYWDDFDSPAEGCSDIDDDSFCDSPYSLSGAVDTMPRVDEVVWPCVMPQLATDAESDWWESYADFLERELTVRYTISNTGFVHAYQVEIDDSICTSGVKVTSSLPVVVAAGITGRNGSAQQTLKYHVPDGVTVFRTAIFATARDGCDNIGSYPDFIPALTSS